MQSRQETAAIASHKALDASWKDVQILLYPRASRSEGPTAPSVRSAMFRIRCPVMLSHIIECVGYYHKQSIIECVGCDAPSSGSREDGMFFTKDVVYRVTPTVHCDHFIKWERRSFEVRGEDTHSCEKRCPCSHGAHACQSNIHGN